MQVVLIEGAEEVGKTTLLAQFAALHRKHSVCLFVRPTSRFTYDPGIVLQDLCNQVHWHLFSEELRPETEPGQRLLNQLLHQLQRKAQRTNSDFCFVVDGLETLPREDFHAVRSIVDLLPFGVPQFKFVISGAEESFRSWTQSRIATKPFTLTGFTFDETLTYFSDLNVGRPFVAEVYRICRKGTPGYMAAIKRLLEKGTPPETLLADLPDRLPGVFQLEWRAVDRDDKIQALSLAILAYDTATRTLGQLSGILGASAGAVQDKLACLSFIEISGPDGQVHYVSQSYRKFAAQQLSSRRAIVRDMLIDWMLGQPESDATLHLLPKYLADAERDAELLGYLDTDHLLKMVERSGSLSSFQHNAELGLTTALKLARDGELVRFAIQKSAAAELDACATLGAEVEARMALGDYQLSMALAQSAVLKQDRLRLLALIGRLQKQRGVTQDPTLPTQLETLTEEVSISELGDKAWELAGDLMFSRPELAIKIIEARSRLAPEDRKIDWALAKLSIIATLEECRSESGLQPTADELRRRIKDPAAFRFSAAVPLLVNKLSADQVIAEVEKLDRASDRIFLLRHWTEHIRQQADAGRVIEYALRLCVRTCEYTPTARDYAQLATPLPSIEDKELLKRLIDMLDAQRGSAEKLGPTEAYVRLQLLLAQAEARIDCSAADKRTLEAYYFAGSLRNPELRSTCLALVSAALELVDPAKALPECCGVRQIIDKELDGEIERLLAETAEHREATRNTLRALAPARPEAAFGIISRLNTLPRRNQALLDCIREHLQQPMNRLSAAFLRKALERIEDPGIGDEGVRLVAERLNEAIVVGH